VTGRNGPDAVGGGRLRVLRGNPTAQEVVAAVVALDLAAAERAASSPAVLPRWRQAARLEALGASQVVAAADLEAARRRPLG
jgi:hypothetical protein